MTFTEQELQKGKALHAELNEAAERRKANPRNFDLKWLYKVRKDNVRSFWLRHGEAALAALGEAWGENKMLLRSLHDIRSCIVNLAQNGGKLNVDDELIALIGVIDDVCATLCAAEEG